MSTLELQLTATDLGRQKIFDAETNSLQLKITDVAVGSNGYTPDPEQESLVAEEVRLPIASSSIDLDAYQININAAIVGDEEFTVREVGFFDEDGDLIFIWSHPTQPLGYKSAPARFLLGMALTITDLPLGSITIQDQGQPLELVLSPLEQSTLEGLASQAESLARALIKQQTVHDRASSLEADNTDQKQRIKKLEEGALPDGLEEDLKGEHQAGGQYSNGIFNQQESLAIMDSSALEAVAEMNRNLGQTGIVSCRKYSDGDGPTPWGRERDVAFAALNMHNHPNYYGLHGMAEVSAMMNGYYIRTRHNDYPLETPAAVGGAFGSTDQIPPPPVPASVLSAGSVAAQTEEMRQYFLAYANQDTGLRDYTPYFTWTLSYFEMWFETMDGNAEDPFNSPRHSIDAANMRELLLKNYYYNYGGFKNRFENVPYQPLVVKYVDANGRPRLAKSNWRIATVPVPSNPDYRFGNELHLHEDLATWERSNLMVDGVKNDDELHASRKTRFLFHDYVKVGGPQFPRDIDELMQIVPGLDGAGANLTESYQLYGNDFTVKERGTTTDLNAAYYNRKFSFSGDDATGRRDGYRGFNDPSLFVSMNTRPEVLDIGGYRFSYAMPLELVLHTPLENEAWNPHGIPEKTRDELRAEAGSQAGPQNDTPRSGYNKEEFFHLTPDGFFTGDVANPDPADTNLTIPVTLPDTSTVLVRNSGTYAHLPPIAGIAQDIRCRWPIYSTFNDGAAAHSTAHVVWKELQRLKTANNLV